MSNLLFSMIITYKGAILFRNYASTSCAPGQYSIVVIGSGRWSVQEGAMSKRSWDVINQKAANNAILKPGVNCFAICNSSKTTWQIAVPKPDENDKTQKGGIMIYKYIEDYKHYKDETTYQEFLGKDGLMYLGDIVSDNYEPINIDHGETYILYVDVPKFMGIKISDFRRKFRLIGTADINETNKVIDYIITRTTKSAAPINIALDPDSKGKFQTKAKDFFVEYDGTEAGEMETYQLKADSTDFK